MPKYKFENVSEKRSKTMRAIRSKNTSPELNLRKALFKRGLRYRIHYDCLPGKPDIVFVNKKIAIFCDGEFWHGKDWEDKKTKIKRNRSYWIPKIERTIERDQENRSKLEQMGWTVLRYWDCDIKENIELIVEDVLKYLKS